MSSKKEHISELRAVAAATIKPGWVPMPLTKWTPKLHKPKIEHLIFEASKRSASVPEMRNAQYYVTWLSTNGNVNDGTNDVATSLLTSASYNGGALKAFIIGRGLGGGAWAP